MQLPVRTHAATEALVPAIHQAVAEVDSRLPVTGIKTQADQIDETIGLDRVFTTLLAVFAGFALLLACLGLHGVAQYAVARRTNEIGIRLALGATRGQVQW